MSLLKQIDDKGAVLEWSPVAKFPNIVALGTKDSAGVGFDDIGGELELHLLDFSNVSDRGTSLLGKVRTDSRFASIAWSLMAVHSDEFPYGLIAGGMVDGNIHVWDPARLAAGDPECLLASVEQHQGSINGLHFNPHKESSHLLASGGSDCEVYVTSIERPGHPSVFVPAPPPNNAKHSADITKVAWNSQVAHILASASQNGSCFIWDLRQKRAWCELRDPSGGCVSDVAWNPDQGLHLVTASGEDKNPVLKLWDLRSSTSLPLATLQGHTEGILSVSWCPADPSLLLSCAKDNRTIMWDLFQLQPVYELSSSQAQINDHYGAQDPASDSSVFGGFASSAGQRRHHVAWSPCLPAVISASTFDRKVQFFSLTGARSKIGRAQKWLRRPVGASFGFGGKLVSFDGLNAHPAATTGSKKGSGSVQIKVSMVVEDPTLVQASDRFHDVIAAGDFKQFCVEKASSGTSEQERQVWGLMKVICFCANAREELLTHLGFDSASITAAAEEYVRENARKNSSNGASTVSASDVFGGGGGASVSQSPLAVDYTNLPPPVSANLAEMVSSALAGEKAEPMIRKAIIVGNFEAAVECCLQAGLMAEALLLAQCGDQNLRIKTQAAFFEQQRHKHPFLNVLHAVIKSELMNYVKQSDLSRWKETLALLSTYGKSDEFPLLCEALAARLELELGDVSSATLCFMCAANVHRTVSFWIQELQEANTAHGQIDTLALLNFVEKVTIFTHANPVDNLGEECSNYFSKYAELLANQGRLEVAYSYLKGENAAEKVLMDRLYHGGNKKAGSRPPPFPFTKTVLESSVTSGAVPTGAGRGALNPSSTSSSTSATSKNMYGGGSAKTAASPRAQEAVTLGNAAAKASGHPASYPAAQTAQRAEVDFAAQQGSTYRGASSAVAAAAQAPAPAPVAATRSLPPGWSQMMDPTSGHPYYVNQATGQSQWEPPLPVPTTSFEPVHAQQPQPQPALSQAASYPNKGQYSHTAVSEPTPAFTSPAAVKTATPVVESPPAVSMPTASSAPLDTSCVAELGQILDALAATIVILAEKRQLDMLKASYVHLCEKVNSGLVNADILSKLAKFVEFMNQRNYAGATAIQTDLVNTAWGQHKEWVKGLKILVQLASKK